MSFNIQDVLAEMAKDPDLLRQLLAAAKTLQSEPEVVAPPTQDDPFVGPIMPSSQITYAQAAFWDNGVEKKTGPKGQTTKSSRFKITLEVWTQPARLIRRHQQAAKNNVVFKRNIALKPGKEFAKILYRNVQSGKISTEFNEACLQWLDAAKKKDDRALFGLINDTNEGWNYFEHQFVVVMWDDTGLPQVAVSCGEGDWLNLLDFEPNEDTESRVKYKATFDRVGYLDFLAAKDSS